VSLFTGVLPSIIRERHDAAGMVELQRHHFSDPDAGEIHAAALAQA
jgi:hypothetical protein